MTVRGKKNIQICQFSYITDKISKVFTISCSADRPMKCHENGSPANCEFIFSNIFPGFPSSSSLNPILMLVPLSSFSTQFLIWSNILETGASILGFNFYQKKEEKNIKNDVLQQKSGYIRLVRTLVFIVTFSNFSAIQCLPDLIGEESYM